MIRIPATKPPNMTLAIGPLASLAAAEERRSALLLFKVAGV